MSIPYLNKVNVVFFILIISISGNLYSQDKKDTNKPFIVFKPDSIDDGRPLITPFVTPGYTPELGGVLAGGAFFSFKMDRDDMELNRSNIPISFSYSTSGAIALITKPVLYFSNKVLYLETNLWYKSMPDNYFGVGYEETIDKEKGDATSYYRDWWWASPKLFWEFKKNLVIGAGFDFNSTIGSEESDEILADETYVKYNSRPYNAGLGFILRYDSRDMPANTYTGFYADLRATYYQDFMGGDNIYNIYELDIRDFIQLGKPGQLLALQARVRIGYGEVPYGEMSMLGSPTDLRGYLWGRLRDKSMAYSIAEYRHKVYWKGEYTRHMLVGWVGVGTIFNNKTYIYNAVPNAGIGYRLDIQPRTSLRLDYGIGHHTTGFYFNFQQAF